MADVILKRVPEGIDAYAISEKANAYLGHEYGKEGDCFPFGHVLQSICAELEAHGLTVEVEP